MNSIPDQKQIYPLDAGLTLRPAQWNDLEAVAELMRDVLIADGDAISIITPSELKREWENEGFTLETDAFVVANSAGRVVGYEVFENRHVHASLMGDGYVHPDFRGLGIGTSLLRALEERARQEIEFAEPDLRVSIMNGMSAADKAARDIHESEGYKPVRFFWVMEVNFSETPKIVSFPASIELRPFLLGIHDRLVFEADDEAFRDHWGHVPGDFEHWKKQKLEHESFEPTLWHIAWDGDQIAGCALTRYRNGMGWVSRLSVRRPWRKRGLGEALLLHAFNEFYKRGMP